MAPRGTQQPQCPQQASETRGSSPPHPRWPRKQGTTQGFLLDHHLSELQQPDVGGDLTSRLGGFCWGYVQGACVSVRGVRMCVWPGEQVCT